MVSIGIHIYQFRTRSIHQQMLKSIKKTPPDTDRGVIRGVNSVKLENSKESLLRHFYRSDLLHALLACFLFFKKFAFS